MDRPTPVPDPAPDARGPEPAPRRAAAPAAGGDPGVDAEALDAVTAELAARGRAYEVREERLLVLDSGVAQRLDDLAFAYAGARASGASAEQAAATIVRGLEEQERRLRGEGGRGRVRLRVTHPDELDPAYTLPGPAGLIVYPVLDEPRAATRLGREQIEERGGLEAVGVAALAPTLAEPVLVQRASAGQWLEGWRVTGDIYTASRVLDAARLVGEVGGDPARPHLVVVPSSREVWVFADAGDPASLAWAGRHARRAYAESLGRISPRVYRWDGRALAEVGDAEHPPAASQPGSSDIGP